MIGRSRAFCFERNGRGQSLTGAFTKSGLTFSNSLANHHTKESV